MTVMVSLGATIEAQRCLSHVPHAINLEGHFYAESSFNAVANIRSRWPLALRFIKGAIHGAIILPVALHTLFAALIVFLDLNLDGSLGLPASIVRSSRKVLPQMVPPILRLMFVPLDPKSVNSRGPHACTSFC